MSSAPTNTRIDDVTLTATFAATRDDDGERLRVEGECHSHADAVALAERLFAHARAIWPDDYAAYMAESADADNHDEAQDDADAAHKSRVEASCVQIMPGMHVERDGKPWGDVVVAIGGDGAAEWTPPPGAGPEPAEGTKTAAVLAEARKGKRAAVIARALGMTSDHVSVTLAKLRRRGLLPPAQQMSDEQEARS